MAGDSFAMLIPSGISRCMLKASSADFAMPSMASFVGAVGGVGGGVEPVILHERHPVVLERLRRGAVAAPVADLRARARGGEEAAAVLEGAAAREIRTDRDKSGQILVLGAEAVGHPRADT